MMYEDNWPKALEKAKEFQRTKPWKMMSDEHVYAIVDPHTEKYLFCSVLGQAEEMYGLAVYIGADGFNTLLDSLTDVKDYDEIVRHQRSLLVSFEDRTDLEREEYEFIKQYDVPFRGKKAWPSFVSFEPGFYPWMMDNEEARQLSLALNESLKMYERMKAGYEPPTIQGDRKMLVRYMDNDKDSFKDMLMSIEEIAAVVSQDDMMDFYEFYVPSEIEIKRAMKNTEKTLDITVEFQATYLMLPIQEDPGERPHLPSAIFVVNHDDGRVYSHQIYAEEINPVHVQNEFLNMFDKLGGTPKEIVTDYKTLTYLAPLLESINVSVEVMESLPAVNFIIKEMLSSIEDFE